MVGMTTPERGPRRHHRPGTRVRGPLATGLATVVAAAALALAVPTAASALPCDPDGGCRHGIVNTAPEGQTGWILYADADGRGSYWTWGVYRQDGGGHCFDTEGVGVGCPG